MLFSYKAKSKTGEVYEGVMDSIDRFTLAHELRSRGSTPISIKEKNKHSFDFSLLVQQVVGRVSVSEQIIFCKNLSGMLHAVLSLYWKNRPKIPLSIKFWFRFRPISISGRRSRPPWQNSRKFFQNFLSRWCAPARSPGISPARSPTWA